MHLIMKMLILFRSSLEPQRKLHLSEDFVAQTMSELYISPPTCKVAKRLFLPDIFLETKYDSIHKRRSTKILSAVAI